MIVETRGLVKIFPAPLFSGGTPMRALTGMDLAAGPGVTGLEGPNGSGKTTLLKTLAGILEPDRGEIRLDGRPAGAAELRTAAAFCPANPRAFYFRLSAMENLRFFGTLAGLTAAQSAEKARALAAALGLGTADLDRRFDRLSEGNMQKVSLIRTFSRRARLLLLDEPFRGLDEKARSGLLELIAEAGRDRALLVSSHDRGLLNAAAAKTIGMEAGRVKDGEAA